MLDVGKKDQGPPMYSWMPLYFIKAVEFLYP